MSSFGLARIVVAAALTAFWSRGVNARSACWTRLPSWPEHGVGHVQRILRDEEDAHAFGADEPHDLLDPVEQRLRRVGEQQMRLVEEEHELRLVGVAHLGQPLVELGRAATAAASRRAVGDCISLSAARMLTTPLPPSVCSRSSMLSIGSPMNLSRALLLERQQPALDRADRRRGDVAVVRLELAARCRRRTGSIARRSFRSSSSRPLSSATLNTSASTPVLRLVEVAGSATAAAGPCRRPSRAPGGPARRTRPRIRSGNAANAGASTPIELQPLGELGRTGARLAHAGEVALDVGHEHRHADRRKALGHHLQRDRLAGAGGAGDEAVAVGERRAAAQHVAVARCGRMTSGSGMGRISVGARPILAFDGPVSRRPTRSRL